MKLLRFALLSLAITTCAAAAYADATPIVVDPDIKVGGPEDPPAPAGIITTTFTIVSPTGTSPGPESPCELFQYNSLTSKSPHCYFENDINPNGVGETITQLSFDIAGVKSSTVNCGFLADTPFADCSVHAVAGGTLVQFTDGSIPFHDDFTLSFQDFPANTSFGATVTATPEPGTMGLLLTGFGVFLVHRKLFSRRSHA